VKLNNGKHFVEEKEKWWVILIKVRKQLLADC